MKIKMYVIDLEIRRRTKKRALLVGIPLAVLLGGSAVLYANVEDFEPGEQLSAGKMNANFHDLQDRIASLESFEQRAEHTGSYSLGATYCGKTALTPGNLSSLNLGPYYYGAKAACEIQCGSTSAHMCTGEELARSVTVGVNIPSANGLWFSNTAAGTTFYGDCAGFTDADVSNNGPLWDLVRPTTMTCNQLRGVACCN